MEFLFYNINGFIEFINKGLVRFPTLGVNNSIVKSISSQSLFVKEKSGGFSERKEDEKWIISMHSG